MQTVTRALLGAVVALMLAGCARKGEEAANDAAAAAVVSVRVGPVRELSVPSVVTAQGQWRAAVEVAANAPFAAIVESLSPRVGDHVRKGETIAQLVTRESHAALRGAELMQRRPRIRRVSLKRAARWPRHGMTSCAFRLSRWPRVP